MRQHCDSVEETCEGEKNPIFLQGFWLHLKCIAGKGNREIQILDRVGLIELEEMYPRKDYGLAVMAFLESACLCGSYFFRDKKNTRTFQKQFAP